MDTNYSLLWPSLRRMLEKQTNTKNLWCVHTSPTCLMSLFWDLDASLSATIERLGCLNVASISLCTFRLLRRGFLSNESGNGKKACFQRRDYQLNEKCVMAVRAGWYRGCNMHTNHAWTCRPYKERCVTVLTALVPLAAVLGKGVWFSDIHN